MLLFKFRSLLRGIKNSISELFSVYAFSKLVQISVMLFCGLFLLDYYDVPSRIIMSVPIAVGWVMLGTVSVMLIAWLLGLHVFDLFRIISVNPLDAIALVVLITSVFYAPSRSFVLGAGLYTTIVQWFAACALIILFVRCCIRCHANNEAEGKRSNLIDLKALYENRFTRLPGKPVLVSENDVDYDLLDRVGITNQLYRSIVHSQPDQSYVISLEGKWGTGKTTIINNVKRILREAEDETKNIVIIDDFDPWLYGTQEALLMAMLDEIIKNTGMRYSPVRTNRMAKELSKTVAESYAAGNLLFNLFYEGKNYGEDVSKLKERVCAYLRQSKKTVVFFIDNLDRANDDNIVFLFKLISIVFDLPGVVYVLSFERERIDAVLSKNHEIDPRFTEKIIQQEIKVPEINVEKVENLYSVSISNLLVAYGVPVTDLSKFARIFRYIVSKTHNVRMYKRMINSVFPAVFCDDTLLNKCDLLAIEVIHFYDPELYSIIHDNAYYFISHERNAESQLEISFGKEAFNAKGKELLGEILPAHEESKELLADMFPYVARYLANSPLEPEYHFEDPKNVEIAKQSRICSGKYFDLYFSYGSNNYIRIRRIVEELVEVINKAVDVTDTVRGMQDILRSLNCDDHKEWVERLQHHLPDITPDKKYFAAVSLYKLIYNISDTSTFIDFGMSARSRAEYLVSELLAQCSDCEFSEFVNSTHADYGQLSILFRICRWLKDDKAEGDSIKNKRAKLLADQYAAMCECVVRDQINLYDNNYYHEGNAWGLYYHYQEKDDMATFTAYIQMMLSAETVYRVIWDTKNCGISSNYIYSIDEKIFNNYIGEQAVVDKLVNDNPPRNKDEGLVMELYDVFKKGKPVVLGHKGITSPTPLVLHL